MKICWEKVERHVLRVPQQRNCTDCAVLPLLNLAQFLSAKNFNVLILIHDHKTFCKKDYSCWYEENIARRERSLMKEYIIYNL